MYTINIPLSSRFHHEEEAMSSGSSSPKSALTDDSKNGYAHFNESIAIDCLLSLQSGSTGDTDIRSSIPDYKKIGRSFSESDENVLNAFNVESVLKRARLSLPESDSHDDSTRDSDCSDDSISESAKEADIFRPRNTYIKQRKVSMGPQRLRIKGPYKDIVNALKYVVEQTRAINASPKNSLYADRLLEHRRSHEGLHCAPADDHDKLNSCKLKSVEPSQRYCQANRQLNDQHVKAVKRFLSSLFSESFSSKVGNLPRTLVGNGTLHFPALWSLSCAAEKFSHDLDTSKSEVLSALSPPTNPSPDGHFYHGITSVLRASQLFSFAMSGLLKSFSGSRDILYTVEVHDDSAAFSLSCSKVSVGFSILTYGLHTLGGELKCDGMANCTFNEAGLIVNVFITFDPTAIVRQCSQYLKGV